MNLHRCRRFERMLPHSSPMEDASVPGCSNATLRLIMLPREATAIPKSATTWKTPFSRSPPSSATRAKMTVSEIAPPSSPRMISTMITIMKDQTPMKMATLATKRNGTAAQARQPSYSVKKGSRAPQPSQVYSGAWAYPPPQV